MTETSVGDMKNKRESCAVAASFARSVFLVDDIAGALTYLLRPKIGISQREEGKSVDFESVNPALVSSFAFEYLLLVRNIHDGLVRLHSIDLAD